MKSEEPRCAFLLALVPGRSEGNMAANVLSEELMLFQERLSGGIPATSFSTAEGGEPS